MYMFIPDVEWKAKSEKSFNKENLQEKEKKKSKT